MTIPSEIRSLVIQLNQELALIEQEATRGINLLRPVLSLFSDNPLLLRFFASLNNVLFFVETYRARIEAAIELLSNADMDSEEAQEAQEELAAMLGVVLETKIRIERIVASLSHLP